tara:strand:+ start:263 stop:568 length:306 start_codon:yes stop_codon:yes gene_type:complete
MKLTKSKLKQLIKEELRTLLSEAPITDPATAGAPAAVAEQESDLLTKDQLIFKKLEKLNKHDAMIRQLHMVIKNLDNKVNELHPGNQIGIGVESFKDWLED